MSNPLWANSYSLAVDFTIEIYHSKAWSVFPFLCSTDQQTEKNGCSGKTKCSAETFIIIMSDKLFLDIVLCSIRTLKHEVSFQIWLNLLEMQPSTQGCASSCFTRPVFHGFIFRPVKVQNITIWTRNTRTPVCLHSLLQKTLQIMIRSIDRRSENMNKINQRMSNVKMGTNLQCYIAVECMYDLPVGGVHTSILKY